MTTRVLIVDPDIQFTLPIKRALEAAGDYVASVFGSAPGAIEMIRSQPHDVAIIDFNVAGLTEFIKTLRREQPDLFILLSPRTSQHVNQMRTMDVQGSITKPYLARQVILVVGEAIIARAKLAERDQQAKRQGIDIVLPVPPASNTDTTPPSAITQPITDFATEPVVQADDTFKRLIQSRGTFDSDKTQLIPASDDLQNIDETRIPDSATIGEIVTGQMTPILKPTDQPPDNKPDNLPEAIPEAPPNGSDAIPDITAESPTLPPAKEQPVILARFALEVADDDTMPFDRSALQALINKIEDEPEPAELLPPWLREAADASDQPTLGKAITPLESPVAPLPESPSQPLQPEVPAESSSDLPLDDEAPIATLAVGLTQLTVNSTAQATLLSRGGTLIAAAGSLSEAAIEGVLGSINEAWRGAESDGNALIRYIRVPHSGDALLYSTRTVDLMILSMLFAAETPIKVIRAQVKQLLTALQNVPETGTVDSEAARTLPSRPTGLRPPEGLHDAITSPAATSPAATPSAEPASPTTPAVTVAPPRLPGPYATYTFMWLPREVRAEVGDTLRENLLNWLDQTAKLHSWEIEGTEIQPQYVTVQISIPANETPAATVETLMRETASHAEQSDVQDKLPDLSDLWAEAYYIVSSGRAITQQEIANFLEYQHETQQSL